MGRHQQRYWLNFRATISDNLLTSSFHGMAKNEASREHEEMNTISHLT